MLTLRSCRLQGTAFVRSKMYYATVRLSVVLLEISLFEHSELNYKFLVILHIIFAFRLRFI